MFGFTKKKNKYNYCTTFIQIKNSEKWTNSNLKNIKNNSKVNILMLRKWPDKINKKITEILNHIILIKFLILNKIKFDNKNSMISLKI